ncbi:hypothetical protein CBR_g34725 [Chara braunii]|uniref:RRM domain-containing protein n=1 Tax=Chara braunii TaxID=69332 RepID=A0A388JYZ3_CHABU|nr:hypothetical protein CBR_g34725 [Chara braunii]|eukprot:GBG63024.1 hypothetical protein CBR_g34725 [Chara braunii]
MSELVLTETDDHGDGNGVEAVRTLFVSGLPQDVKDRELYVLFRPYDGYESSQIRVPSRSPHPVGFAVFVDQATAVVARDGLNGTIFDPSNPSVKLRVELAKTNSKPKRARPEEDPADRFDRKYRGPPANTAVQRQLGESVPMYMPAWATLGRRWR